MDDEYVWVRTPEDGVWWPAVTIPTPPEFADIPLDGEVFVRVFFPGRSADQSVYPVSSTDADVVRPLCWARNGPDALFFRDPRVEASVVCAAEHRQQRSSSVSVERPSRSQSQTAVGGLPFSPETQQKIERLLASLDAEAAATLRPVLYQQQAISPATSGPPSSHRRQSSQRPVPIPEPPTIEAPSPSASAEVLSRSAGGDVVCTGHDDVDGEEERPEFEEAALEVLRMETFDNRDKFILNPTAKFVNLLGAVAVQSTSVRAELPNRNFMYEGDHRTLDRILLIPFDPVTYHHGVGWMERVTLERDVVLRIFINGQEVDVPPNWSIAASKTGSAVRSAIPLDITDVIECTLPEEEAFEIRVEFENSALVPDMALWDVILACIMVEEIPLDTVCATIRDNCRAHVGASKPKLSRRARRHDESATQRVSGVETQEVSTKCPLTSVTLEVPCRGRGCEHPQCMELSAILQQCCRRHVWNCPLCNEAMSPDSILVDYALMDLLRPKRGTCAEDTVLWHDATGSYSLRPKRMRSQDSAELVID